MEVPGVQLVTSWLVGRHSAHSANKTPVLNVVVVIIIIIIIIIIILLLSMLLISRTVDLWIVLPYVRLINCHLHLFRSSASSFSSQYLLLFLRSSRSCVLVLPTPFTSVLCPSMASRRRQFLLTIWPIQLAFLLTILFIIILFSPIRSINDSLVTFSDHLSSQFSSSTKFQSSPNTSTPIFLVPMSLSHIKHYSKHNT